MKIVLLIQARVTSSRYPNKVLKKIVKSKLTVVDMIYHRLKKCKNLSKILFVIPKNKNNQKLSKHLKNKRYPFFLALKIMS